MKITLKEAKRRLDAAGFKCNWHDKRTQLLVWYGDNCKAKMVYIAEERDVVGLIRWRNDYLRSAVKSVR